jgi:hypothetical protein
MNIISKIFSNHEKRTSLQKISFYLSISIAVLVLFFCALLPSRRKNNSLISNSRIKELMRSCLQLLEASKQDSNSVIRLAHANYAQGYYNVARMLQTDEEIEESTGIDIRQVQDDLDSAQKEAMRSIAKQSQIKF